ncbi:sperm microtubule associated protein 1-like [Watersipora subatra]|uniref:sperm microtubule associated protein 1-like n=1 Tax=Watersipora subatra TaxID=2589382 RepID=UPI00355AF890
MSSSTSKSPRGRLNKIYRTPPTPTPDELMRAEKTFVLDCQAASSISSDYSKANPKLGPVVPPYNGQRDSHTDGYFKFVSVPQSLKFYKQASDKGKGTSIDGPVMDRFSESGAGFQYLSLRNQHGAGHSRQEVDGHAQFMKGIKPITGFNGAYGYRRNTPWLRTEPSPFGTASRSPTH